MMEENREKRIIHRKTVTQEIASVKDNALPIVYEKNMHFIMNLGMKGA